MEYAIRTTRPDELADPPATVITVDWWINARATYEIATSDGHIVEKTVTPIRYVFRTSEIRVEFGASPAQVEEAIEATRQETSEAWAQRAKG